MRADQPESRPVVVNALTPDGRSLLRQAVKTFRGADLSGNDFSDFPGAVAFVAVDGDAVVGWCWGYLRPRPDATAMAYLHELEVIEEHRRRGVGRELVTSFANVVRTRGAFKMFLTTGASNVGARALYDSAGGSLPAQGPTVNYWFQLPLA